ncbi:MAG: GntR family transcriptional regulator [Thermomicrobiales bacterium]|nr:GntR family transcriptional regulator [Thermomicrobiales bacterium]
MTQSGAPPPGADQPYVLQRQQGLSAHAQIEAEIARRIESGILRPGDQIPPERELVEQMQVSRMTLRQGLTRLVDRGLLERQRGRGTFVREPKLIHSLSNLTGLHGELLSQGITPAARLLTRAEIPAPPAVADLLEIAEGDPVYWITRLRLGAGVPIAHETSYFPVHLVPGLLDEDLETGSIYELMGRYAARPVGARQSLEPVVARAEEAALLDITPGSPVMLIERIARDAQDRAVEYAKDLYRGDRSRFLAELTYKQNGWTDDSFRR